MASSPMKILDAAGAIQARLFGPGKTIDYLLLMMLAALPLVLSAQIGIAHTQVPTIGGAHETCMGYWDRTNWVSLIVLLPVALWTARIVSDLLFCHTARF
jgi:hypothetical protein